MLLLLLLLLWQRVFFPDLFHLSSLSPSPQPTKRFLGSLCFVLNVGPPAKAIHVDKATATAAFEKGK